MSVPDRSIDPRLLSSATEEFLNNGYEKSSLAEICRKAGVTTGALYKRYKGKEDLFSALVSDTIRDLEEFISSMETTDRSQLTDEELYEFFSMSAESNRQWIKFLYDHKVGMTLLIRCSEGSRYSSFHHDITEKINRLGKKIYQEAQRRGMTDNIISPKELQVLTYCAWGLFFEPFYYDFTREEIEKHADVIHEFLDWHKAFGMKDPNTE